MEPKKKPVIEFMYNLLMYWVDFVHSIFDQIQKTILTLLRPAGITWLTVTYLKSTGTFEIDSMSYVILCVGIMGVKAYRRIKTMSEVGR